MQEANLSVNVYQLALFTRNNCSCDGTHC